MMHAYNRSRWFVLGAIAVLTLSSFTAQGNEISQAVTQTRAQINQFCRTNNLRSSNHQGIPHFEVKGSARALRDGYIAACGPNAVEFFKEPLHGHTYHHLYTRIGENTFSRIWSLYKSSWYPSSSSNGERVGVICQLTNNEMRNFQAFMTENQNSPNNRANPHGAIGNFNVGGGGADSSHCTNYLSKSKEIGANGESLPQLFGQSYTGIAPSWISGLIRSGGPRIIGVAVHNPQGSLTDLSRFW